MYSLARSCRRVAALLAVAWAVFSTLQSASADVIVTVGGSATSSASAVFGGSPSQTNNATGTPDLSNGSTAAASGWGIASNTNSESLTVTSQPNGTVTVAGNISNSGGAAGLASSSGLASLLGSIQLTRDYYYSISAHGTNSSAGVGIAGDSLGMSGFGVATGNFTFNDKGVLPTGTYNFGGSASGGAAGLGGYSSSVDFTLTLTPVPEPASIVALGAGVVGLAGYTWRRKRKAKR